MLIDCHVHSVGKEKADEVINALDSANVDKALIFAPYPGEVGGKAEVSPKPTEYMQFSYAEVTQEMQRRSAKFIFQLQARAPDRIVAFAWIEPRVRNAVRDAEEAVTKFDCKGIKMIPDHRYPHDTNPVCV